MGVLKRKEERSAVIQVRVPASVKGQLEELRRAADDAGFDLGATITETITRLVKQIHDELDGNLPRAGDAKRATATVRLDRSEQGLSANGREA
ncbi:MAG: hypothetical protein IVW54_10995 [Candidatus Binataceae bacterium]|nr:hypothetical protein [Candidatus Binataceae bacterium]